MKSTSSAFSALTTFSACSVFGLAALACLIGAGAALSAPQPSEVPIKWELDFRFQPLQAVAVQVPGDKAPRLFWYLRYQVTNRTGEDRVLIPGFSMYTQTGQLTPAGRNVPAYVFGYLKKMLNDPFLKDTAAVTGKILQGEDNSEDGLAIWPDFDAAAGSISIFVAGLSGENIEIQLPSPVAVSEMDSRGNVKDVTKTKLVLTKTLELDYQVPGEAASRLHAPVKLQEKKWVMR